MIDSIIRVTCDDCGKVVERIVPIRYTGDGLFHVYERSLVAAGWAIDHESEDNCIVRVACPDCK